MRTGIIELAKRLFKQTFNIQVDCVSEHGQRFLEILQIFTACWWTRVMQKMEEFLIFNNVGGMGLKDGYN